MVHIFIPLAVFILCSLWQVYLPFRVINGGTSRIARNLTVAALGIVLGRICLPIGLAGVAFINQQWQFGALNQIALPLQWQWVIGFLLLDLSIYWQHRCTHTLPMLWKLHRVHHIDASVDASTSLRFHPIEAGLSTLYKAAVILIVGIDATTVITFATCLTCFAMFVHTNIILPQRVEKVLRCVIVTQQLHRIHHSQVFAETNSNYGTIFVYWDWLFGSYTAQATLQQQQLQLGVAGWMGSRSDVWGILQHPFITRNAKP